MKAFSTCWNTSRHDDGEAIIEEILELGFDHIELSHGITLSKIPGIERAYEQKMFTCVGVHNFFPSPTEIMTDAPDAYEFTHFRETDRERAYRYSVQTLEEAARYGAKYVVLHMGSNHKMPSAKWSKPLEKMLKEGEAESKKFLRHRNKFLKKREKTAKFYMLRATYYLEQLEKKARELDLVLAIESRSHYEQVPTESEMLTLMEHFKDSPHVQYWHDFGHVQRKHNLGLLDHAEWLGQVSPHLYGGHLHDVQNGTRDHRVPLKGGDIQYDQIMPYFTPDMPLVWELSPGRRASQIREALAEWEALYPGY